jgi:flagellar protein FlaJ
MKKAKIVGIIFALVTVAVDIIFLREQEIFYFLIAIAFVIAALPFIVSLAVESSKEKEKEEKFLDFSRDLVEGVKSGTPISRSILNVQNKDYGALSPHIKKMANQISIGIPVRDALGTFAKDLKNRTIIRSVALIREAERTGGNIEVILDSVANSMSSIEKLKKERQSSIYSLVIQGYIIYFIFIVIILVMQFQILPMTRGVTDLGTVGDIGISTVVMTPEKLSAPFLYLLLTQGFFAGLIIGKLSMGSIKAGLKHSAILMIISVLSSTGANLFM